MKRLLLMLACTFCVSISWCQTPALEWAKRIGGTGDDYIQSIFTDTNGDVYIAGSFTGTVDFDPGSGVTNLTASGSSFDAFFARYNNSGSLLGAYQLSGTLNEEIYAITADASGVYVAGGFQGTVDFNPALATTTNRTASGTGSDMFFGKFSNTGVLSWINAFGSSGDNDFATAIALDGAGNLFVTGAFTGTVDFDPIGTVNQTSEGGLDIFFGRYDKMDGHIYWAHSIGSLENDQGRAIVADNLFVWVGGFYSDDLISISGGTNFGLEDGLFIKYDKDDGAIVTGGTIVSTGSDAITSIALDGNGNVITGGYFSDEVSMFGANSTTQSRTSNGGTDIFIAKHNSSTLDLLWLDAIGGTGDDGCNLLMVDGSSNIYVTGFFKDIVDFDPAGTVASLQSTGGYDAFISKLTSSGTLAWASKLGSSNTLTQEQGTSVSVDASANVYVAGIFTDEADADPGAGSTPLTSLGLFDGFFVKVNQTQPPTISSFNPASGTEGTTVTITGTNFSTTPANNTVKFNGTTATVTASTATSITTSVPSGASTGKITVTVNGITATSATDFTVNATLATEPSAQPTNLVFSEITPNGFDFSFNAASGNPTGYLGIRKTGSATTSPPIDGVTYTAGTEVVDGVVFFVGDGTSYFWENASPSTTYYLDIFAYNGSGSSINYRTISPLKGSVTTLPETTTEDTTPPEVMANTTPSLVLQNATVPVSVQFADPESGVSEARIYYSATEKVQNYEEFVVGTMNKVTETNYTFTIPATETELLGVTYFFYIKNGAGLEYWSSYYVTNIRVEGDGFSIPFNSFGNKQTNYRIISIPITATTSTVTAILGDDLGEADKANWRIFQYQGSSTTELSGSSQLQPRRGYWLIANKSAQLDTGPGTMPSVSLEAPAAINLSQGWNLIGNPYPFDVSWSDILDWNNNPAQVTNLRTFKGNWANGSKLEAFSGGFVMSTGSVTLEIPVFSSASGGRKGSGTNNREQPLDAEDWEVDLRLKSGDISYDLAGIGMNRNADIGMDKFDDFTLPRFMEYVELNHSRKFMDYALSRDVVPTEAEHTWDFSVETNTTENIVELSWSNEHFGDNDRQLILWDVAQQRAVDMRSINTYSFNKKHSKDFRIFYGSQSFVREQTKVNRPIFHNAFPNPVTDQVTFSFSVPETAKQQPVSIEVVDMLGKKVSTVFSGNIEPGYHEVVWDGKDENGVRPASGVYVTYLKNGSINDQYRIVIK